ncbi:MAG: NfeD family protein [Oscillospiraceae bacterium]
MNEWWESLSTLLRILYCVAAPSTLILLIQTLMSLFGFHDGGSGTDFSDTSGIDFDAGGMDGNIDISSGGDMGGLHDITTHDISGHHQILDGGNPSDFTSMRMFTLQTIVAFLTVFSWTSIVAVQSGMPPVLGITIGLVLGFLTMFMVAKIIQLSTKLAENGTLNMKNCIGECATVYVPVPPKGSGEGKVTLTVQGQFRELSAVTNEPVLLKTGTQVRITDLRGDDVVVETED